MLPYLHNRPELRCTARTKHRNLEQCLNVAAYGMKVCRFHGARKPETIIKGADHHYFTHGNETRAKRAARVPLLAELAELKRLVKQIQQMDKIR